MKKNKFFSVLLAVVVLFNVIILPQSVSALEDSLSWQDKIDKEVYKSPIYENGKRLIYIDRVNIPKETVSKHLLKNYKYNTEVYENEERYEAEIVPAVTARVVSELGQKEAYSTQKQFELTGERLSAIDLALSEDYDNYIMAKRSATKDLYVTSTDGFIAKNVDNEKDVVYRGKYVSSLVLYATDAEIKKYAKCADVVKIVPHYNYEGQVDAVPTEQTQIAVDSIGGTKSSQFNYGNGYKGTGVKIGIIEYSKGRYYDTCPQLSSISGTQLQFISNGNTTTNTGDYPEHATMVTALIVGQEYTVDGCTYEGVVPNATAYQVAVSSWDNAKEALDELADRNVSVINLSGGNLLSGSRYIVSEDGYMDEFIESTGITFVKSAGNNGGAVTSPGKAYNAITVGNLWTKDYNVPGDAPAVFEIFPYSSYMESEYLSNKPDVVAPGTGIKIPLSVTTTHTDTGTSFAAPLVTGIVAQLHQAKPFLRVNPTATKAIIIAGSSYDDLYIGNDPLDNDSIYLRERMGAGLVNAANSIEIALNNQYYYGDFDLSDNFSGMPTLENFIDFYVPAGQKIRLVMTFHKIDKASVPETGFEDNINFNVYEYDTGESVASAYSVYNNVEVVEFSATETTHFYVDVILQSFVPASSTCLLPFSFAAMFIDE